MKKTVLILILVLFCATIAHAQLSNDITGKTWLKANNQQRTLYLKGLYAAFNMCDQDPGTYVPFVNDYDKTREALRKFYVPIKNHKIAVSAALVMINMEQDGATKEEIEKFRKNYEFGGWRR